GVRWGGWMPMRGRRGGAPLTDCRSCDGSPISSRRPGRTRRWIPEFTPDFHDGCPNPSHPTTQNRAPERDETPNPSHPTTRNRVPERDETPNPSHPTTRNRAPERHGSPNPSRRAVDHEETGPTKPAWSYGSSSRSRAVPVRHQRNPARSRRNQATGLLSPRSPWRPGLLSAVRRQPWNSSTFSSIGQGTSPRSR